MILPHAPLISALSALPTCANSPCWFITIPLLQYAASADDVIPDPVLALVKQAHLPSGLGQRRLLASGGYGSPSVSFGYGSPNTTAPGNVTSNSTACSDCVACMRLTRVGVRAPAGVLAWRGPGSPCAWGVWAARGCKGS